MHRFLSFCLFILCATTLPAETFRNPYRIPTASDPNSVIVADLNGDGLPDIIYGDSPIPSGSLHILLAQPGGGYTPAPTITLPAFVGVGCRALDTNRDGKQDLVCPYSNAFSGSLVTFLGNGDGTFAVPMFTPLPTWGGNYFDPVIYTPSDLNSDGVPDLMVLDALNQQVYVMLGDGTGSYKFASKISSSVPAMAIDVNGDGKPDLVFDEGPYVMLGNGDGTFAPYKSYSQTFDYNNVCTYADMDGDGHVDAVCGYVETITGDIDGATHLIILHGNADGSFNPTPISDKVFGNHDTQYDGLGSFQSPLLVSDLNHDGIPDIIAYSGDGFTVLLGQPNLNFSDPKHYVAATGNVGGTITQQQIVDINNDGQLDIVTAGTNGVYICYGKPDGTFDTALAYEVAQVLGHATFADFNGDGTPDIAATGDTTIEVSLGNGDGTFAPYKPLANANINFSTPLSVGNAYILHGDFNGDGKQDLLAIGSSSIYQYDSYLYFGHGDGTFDPLIPVPNSSTIYPGFYSGEVADLNGDGRDDILTSDTNSTLAGAYPNIYVGLSNGDGTFRPITTKMPSELMQQNDAFNAPNCSPALADFNHDGKLDAAFGAVANVYVLKGHGDGSFDSTGTVLPIPSVAGTTSVGTLAVAAGDFDGDGNQDIAVLYVLSDALNQFPNNRAVFIYYGNGDSTFSAPVIAGLFSHSYKMVTASDLNGDGRADLILRGDNSPYERPAFAIVHSMPGRSFGPEINYLVGNGFADLAALDVNRDGHPDILVTNGVGSAYNVTAIANAVTVLLNQSDVPVVSGTLTSNPNPSIVGQPFTLTATLAPPPPSTATLAGLIQFAIDGIDAGSATLSSNAATITAPSPLSIGTHTATAIWFGNSTYPAITLTATHTVEGIPVTLNLTSSLNPAAVGQAVTLSATVANSPTAPPSTPAPTGTLTFTDNGTLLGTPVSITGGGTSSWSLLKGFSTGGKHIIVVTYSGDAIHSPATATLTQIVTALPTATVLQSSLNPSPAGQSVTFTATVTAQPENSLNGPFQASSVTFNGLPGGAITRPVTFSSQDTPAAVIGTATYTTNTLLPGTYTITAAFSGNASFNPSTSTALTQVVNSAVTTTTLTANPNPAYVTQTVTLSAVVNSPIGTPTGTIQFFDGATPLATVPLTSGNATFATALLSPGDHTITALYSGDTNNLPSTSSPITETILPSDFTLSIDPSSLTLVTGHHTTLTLTATSVGSFADTIHLTIGSLPQWTTVTFTPTDLTLTPGGKATTRVYVDTDAVIGYISQSQPKRNPFSTAIATTLALILLPLTNRRTRRLPTLIALAITATLLIGATGCSGMYPGSTAPGTYNLQITATGKQTPITHTLNLPLTVTK